MGSLRDRKVEYSASDRHGSNFESCVWRAVSSHSSHHPQEVILAQFSLYVHKGGLKPHSFHFRKTLHIIGGRWSSSSFLSPRVGFSIFYDLEKPILAVEKIIYHIPRRHPRLWLWIPGAAGWPGWWAVCSPARWQCRYPRWTWEDCHWRPGSWCWREPWLWWDPEGCPCPPLSVTTNIVVHIIFNWTLKRQSRF